MAPGYRNQNRRQNRTGYVDHDVFEGLPVRQWRRDYTTIVPPATQETTTQNDIWAVELPHGMPKDSHLLPQHSQDLLRAARSGKIYKRPAPVEEEEADAETILGDKTEKKDDDPKDKGYTVKAWKPVPRHLEGPDIEYLAKRRKGLITVAAKSVAAGPTLTKATVKRIDAAGNEYVQDIIVPQGQKVEGDVISQTIIPDPSANGAEGLLVATPHKRKGPPKRKLKGPGRGRKKKLVPPTSASQIPQADGITQSGEGVDDSVSAPDIKDENEGTSTPMHIEDTEMADGSTRDSDDDEGEEGEDGDDIDEGSVDNQGSPSKAARPNSSPPQNIPTMTEIPSIGQTDTDMSGLEATARPPMLHLDRDRIQSGSPLKNVALTTSALTSPLESPSSTAGASFSISTPAQELQPIPETTELASLNEEMQQEATHTAPPSLPSPPPQATSTEELASAEVLKEEEEEEEMLLDIVENANNASIGATEVFDTAVPEVPESIITPIQEAQQAVLEEIPAETPEVLKEPEDGPDPVDHATVDVPQPDAPQSLEEEDGDDFPDLLGGLEKQLNDPVDHDKVETPPVAESAPEEKPDPEKPAESAEQEHEESEAASTSQIKLEEG